MATSLAAQLQQLQTPQTTRFLENDKKRASLLFNPKEAANLDRETVFNIGKNGLDELIKLSNVFKDFEDTLFAQSSIHLERSIHDTKLNKSLNKQIEKFLILLSPYFLLSTAHKALEWLIYRYKIHQYNKDQYMLLILPYHETRMFIRALQLVDVSANRDKWNWLKPLQKPGIPLSSLTLVNRLTVDNNLLELLSNHVISATTIYQDKANCLNILYAFYTIAITGSIERSKTISEIQVNHILPTLMNSLESTIPDYVGCGIMILARLSIKQRLNDDTITHLLLKALKNPVLKHEIIMLHIFLYEASNNEMTHVPYEIVEKMCEYTWVCDEIIKIKNSSVDIIKFIVPFLETSIKTVLNKQNSYEINNNIKNTVIKIFEKIIFDEYEVNIILNNTLKSNLICDKLSNDSKSFLSHIYGLLEVRYSNCFDDYLKNLMKKSETCIESKKSLQFLMSWHSGAKRAQNSLNAFDKLNHFIAEYRISALNDLSAGKIDIDDGFEGMVKKSIIERFNDDNVDVVKALLNFPIKRLKSLFPSDNLIERLMILLSQCHTEKKHVLAKPALKLLLELCDDGDDTSVFLAILPYLFPTTDEEVDIAVQILNSEFSKKNQYLQDVRKEICNDDATAKSIGDAAFHSLMSSGLFPPTENIITTMKLSSNGDATSLFFNLVLLGSVCRRKIGEISHNTFCEMIEMASDMIKQYPKVKSIPGCNHLTNEQIQPALELTSKGILPLQAGTYVLEMVFRRLDLKTTLLDFENNTDLTKLVMCIFEFILDGIHSSHLDKKRHYSWVLKIFVQRHFHTTESIMEFLSQGFISPVKPKTSFQCLKMALSMFDSLQSFKWIFEKKIFVTNLLIALSRDNKTCRQAAVDLLKRLFQTFNINKMNGISSLLAELYKKSNEISIDHEQISLILYNLLSPDPDVSSQLTKSLKLQMKEAREFLFNITLDENIPIHIKAQLLDVLSHVNGIDVLEKLTPKGLELMKIIENNTTTTTNNNETFTKIALKNILYRFNSTTVKALKNDNVWKLFELAFLNNNILIKTEYDNQLPSIIIIKQIDDIFFENAGKISINIQKKILSKLVDIVTDCEINNVVVTANRTVQKIKINAQLIVDELENMKNAKLPDELCKTLNNSRAKRRSKLLEMTKRPELINTREWKRGITILEFIQRAENIDNENLLVPVLFDLLRMCLSFEEQSPLEYTNQLLLTTIYNLAVKNLPIPNAHLQVDLISQCIRTSQNPQTHHHALLVLVELLKICDIEIALNNIMPIFTFMGSSVLRQDDAYSIQIISKTIETIVPIINSSNDEKHACEILRIFVVSLPDIPEHRRISLFIKLLQLLENHLHLFYLLTFEADVLSPIKEKNDDDKITQRLKFALTISQEFKPKKIIDVCIKLAKFFKSLPIEIDDDDDNNDNNIQKFKNKHIYDVYKNTPKQLRHYKYLILQFLSKLLSSIDFINRVAIMDNNEIDDIKLSYDNLIIEIILLIQITSKSADKHQGKSKGKYWKVIVHSLYDILDAVNNLLPNQLFIISVKKLIDNEHLTVKRKALELLNSRLQHKKFNDDDQQSLLTLIIPLLGIITKSGKMLSQEIEVIQQTSLITLKLLAKNLAVDNPNYFKPVLELTTEFMKIKEGPLLASVVLCVAELVSTMRTHAIPLINKFVPSIIELLKIHCHQDTTSDVLVISIVSALQKIVDSLGNFFSLYLDQILCELCRLNTRYTDNENSKTTIIITKLKATSQKLASCISLRVMLPAVSKTYTNMINTKSYKTIPSLMLIFSESFGYLQTSDLQTAVPELANFFLRVLQFRENLNYINNQNNISDEQMEIDNDDNDNDNILNDIKSIEESAGKSLVNLVLKLSEATFRPLYYKLYDWAARNPDKKLRSITFYRLSSNIAESLKSLFVLFAGHFLTHAAQLLTHNNLEVNENKISEHTLEHETNRIELIEAILSTLNKVFSYDANNFVNQERFDTLCQPIVDQIENTVGTKKQYELRAHKLIVPCIASFSSAIQDDSLHKLLVYQVLIKTRHNKSYVRSTALSTVVEIARKLGQDFMPLLPETVPFLAELLEDEDADTEKLAQNAVRTLEEVLGENLQKYF